MATLFPAANPRLLIVGDQLDPGDGGELFGRTVARAVVDDDHASRLVELGERLEAGDRVGDAPIVEHDDADARVPWRHARRTYRPVDWRDGVSDPTPGAVVVLCGGVGAARFLAGAVQVRRPSSITAVVNTADDAVINGLAISPDLDTVVYTLAGAIDPQRGWGLAGETWTAMDALERYVAVRPAASAAAITWFRLGDRDLATHLYRTARRAEGATLTEITAEIAAAWNVGVRVLPMTDDAVSTHLILADGTELAFQDYFVRLHHDVEVSAVRIDTAEPGRRADVMTAIERCRPSS